MLGQEPQLTHNVRPCTHAHAVLCSASRAARPFRLRLTPSPLTERPPHNVARRACMLGNDLCSAAGMGGGERGDTECRTLVLGVLLAEA